MAIYTISTMPVQILFYNMEEYKCVYNIGFKTIHIHLFRFSSFCYHEALRPKAIDGMKGFVALTLPDHSPPLKILRA